MAYNGKYETPSDLMEDSALSRNEKIAMLEAWRDDKKAYMRASDEGMAGTVRADFLKEIKKALASLQSQ